MQEWIHSSINRDKITIPITDELENHLSWALKVQTQLLSSSPAWYQLHLDIGVLPGGEIPCSLAMHKSVKFRAILPVQHPHVSER